MRRVKITSRAWAFALTERERDFLHAVLRAYPAVPRDHHTLSRESASRLNPEDEELLLEALTEHRDGHKAKLRRWLKGGARFKQVKDEWQFSLARTDFDWMLQVLNDVRVGYWIQLGSPDDVHNPIELLQKDPTAFFHMEAAGMFQMQLLHAVQDTPDPD
jgi:hypothetical protein